MTEASASVYDRELASINPFNAGTEPLQPLAKDDRPSQTRPTVSRLSGFEREVAESVRRRLWSSAIALARWMPEDYRSVAEASRSPRSGKSF